MMTLASGGTRAAGRGRFSRRRQFEIHHGRAGRRARMIPGPSTLEFLLEDMHVKRLTLMLAVSCALGTLGASIDKPNSRARRRARP